MPWTHIFKSKELTGRGRSCNDLPEKFTLQGEVQCSAMRHPPAPLSFSTSRATKVRAMTALERSQDHSRRSRSLKVTRSAPSPLYYGVRNPEKEPMCSQHLEEDWPGCRGRSFCRLQGRAGGFLLILPARL